MNIAAILLIFFGFALLVMGWTGSYANVWQYVSGGTFPQSQPSNGTQSTPMPVNPGASGTPQPPTQYNLNLGNHLNG